jgi:SAM-dependent methyltransferase
MLNTKFNSESNYFHHLRMPLLSLATHKPIRVLEVGCAAGQSLIYFKERGTEFVAGVEIFPEIAQIARDKESIDKVITGNIEQIELPFEENYFDLIIAGFVIEHVADPWCVLNKLNKYLKPGGQLIGSLPNVRHISVVLPLLTIGKWEYTEEGIMDWTHLRFFSKSTIEDILSSTGFTVHKLIPQSDDQNIGQ